MHAYFTSTGDFHLILAVQTERTFLLLELNVVQSFIVVLQFRSQNERQITKLTLHFNFTRAAYRPYQICSGICSILIGEVAGPAGAALAACTGARERWRLLNHEKR
jgi:hypothetical protein